MDKACTVEGVLELGVFCPNRINRNIMKLHLSLLSDQNENEIFSETEFDDERVSMVQISRQDNYANQEKALELNIYIFGQNYGACQAMNVKDSHEL